MGKKSKQLLGDLYDAKPGGIAGELYDSVSRWSSMGAQQQERWGRKQEEHRKLEKQVADLLDIDVDWSPEDKRWYLSGKLPLGADDDANIGLFDPLNDASIAIKILSSFYLATENVPGSFLAAGISRTGRRCFARTDGNEIIEVICRVAVDINR